MIAGLFPLVRPHKIGPGRVDMEKVKPESRMETIAVGEDLGCNDRTQHNHRQEGYQPFPIGIEIRSSPLELRTDKIVTFAHRSIP